MKKPRKRSRGQVKSGRTNNDRSENLHSPALPGLRLYSGNRVDQCIKPLRKPPEGFYLENSSFRWGNHHTRGAQHSDNPLPCICDPRYRIFIFKERSPCAWGISKLGDHFSLFAFFSVLSCCTVIYFPPYFFSTFWSLNCGGSDPLMPLPVSPVYQYSRGSG